MNDDTTSHHYLQWRQEQPTWWERLVTALQVGRRGGSRKAWEWAIGNADVNLSHRLRRYGWSAHELNDWTLTRMMPTDVLANCLLAGANPNTKENNNYFDFLLHRMAAAGQKEVVELLLDLGAKTDVRCGNQFTPLGATAFDWGVWVADWDARKEVIHLLLDRGVRADALEGKYDLSVLARAPMEMDLFDRLVKAGAPTQWISQQFIIPPNEELERYPVQQNVLFRLEHIENTPQDLNRWLHWMARNGVELTKPFDNSYIAQRDEWLTAVDVWVRNQTDTLSNQDLHKILDVFEHHGFDLTNLGPNGRTIWHTLLGVPSSNILQWFEVCLERPNVADVLRQVDDNGVSVFDLMDETIASKKSHHIHLNSQTIEALTECKALVERLEIAQAVETQTNDARSTVRRKM